MTSASSVESVFQKNPEPMEQNYFGLLDCSSVDSSDVPILSEVKKNNLNLKATELRLGLPGSQSPERDLEASASSEKPLFPLLPSKDKTCLSSQRTVVSGNKRGFSDTMEGCSKGLSDGSWMFDASGKSVGPRNFCYKTNASGMISSGAQLAMIKETESEVVPQEQSHASNGSSLPKSNRSNPPAAKAQVVGWPPFRSFHKNILATSSKNSEEVDGKPGPAALLVKVSMDGAPYLRKVDLRSYSTYQELSSALEKMFSSFTMGQWGYGGASGKERLSESKLRDLLHGSEYVLTYEDKDGDWMLVGDVPWDMFIGSCKRLKIMKGSDAIGLERRMENSFCQAKTRV